MRLRATGSFWGELLKSPKGQLLKIMYIIRYKYKYIHTYIHISDRAGIEWIKLRPSITHLRNSNCKKKFSTQNSWNTCKINIQVDFEENRIWTSTVWVHIMKVHFSHSTWTVIFLTFKTFWCVQGGFWKKLVHGASIYDSIRRSPIYNISIWTHMVS